jgi:hypothetical protein
VSDAAVDGNNGTVAAAACIPPCRLCCTSGEGQAGFAIATAVAFMAARACTNAAPLARSSTPDPTAMADGGQALAVGRMLMRNVSAPHSIVGAEATGAALSNLFC